MASSTAERAALEIPRGDREKLVIEAREFHGREFIDLRIHVKSYSGAWVPTTRSVTIRDLEELDQVVLRLQELGDSVPGPSL
jgi:hypothetical protein